jgi:hypothetical protein
MLTSPAMIDNTTRIFFSAGITGGLGMNSAPSDRDRSSKNRPARKDDARHCHAWLNAQGGT